MEERYIADMEAILALKNAQGGDLWTTPDQRLLKGGCLSTLACAMILLELGVPREDPVLVAVAELVFSKWREDGRFKLAPDGAMYPCQTIHAVNTLCQLGYIGDARVLHTLRYLLDIQHSGGGWRCAKFSFGHGPETECANPGPTLTALNAFRFSKQYLREPALEKAVEFLLEHWVVRKPIGPCHYGIGTLFMQVEYPFGNYNLFQYVHVLSFYEQARGDSRFLEALSALEHELSEGRIIVERVNPKLARLSFCKKGCSSDLATRRYNEILRNISR